MKARDMRPWVVNDRNFTPGYASPSDEDVPGWVILEGLEKLLDSAAAAGAGLRRHLFTPDNRR